MAKIFAPKAYAAKIEINTRASKWVGRCNLDGYAPMTEKALAYIYTGIRSDEPKKIKKGVKALDPATLNNEQIQVSLLLAESLYIAGCYYPPKAEKAKKADDKKAKKKAEKPKEPHYFDKAESLCRKIIISSDADPVSMATAKTILGRILMERYAFDPEAKALLEEAGTPVALFTLAQLKQNYASAGHANYLEAARLYKKINAESLPQNVQAILKNNLAVSLFLYGYAKRKDETVQIDGHLLEAIGSMKEAIAISNSDYDRISLGAICSGAVLALESRKSLSGQESKALDTVQSELRSAENYFTDMRARKTGRDYDPNVRASWPHPRFIGLPESFAIDSIAAKAN
jgi:hypothetical protein